MSAKADRIVRISLMSKEMPKRRVAMLLLLLVVANLAAMVGVFTRSEEHTSELQSQY